MPLNTFPVTLERSFMITPKVKHFVFSCQLSPLFDYLPGQFITIHFQNEGKLIRRSYSIANPPQQDNRIEFAAGFFAGGAGTNLLYNLKPGEVIHINGPFGRLTLKEPSPKRYIFVSTSTGVTPYRAMLPELSARLKQHSHLKVVILQGIQYREDILYREEFQQFAKQHPKQVEFKTYFSQQKLLNTDDYEYSGYVQDDFPELKLDPSQDMVYLCGNPGMIDAAFNYLKEQNFALPHIIREKYISS